MKKLLILVPAFVLALTGNVVAGDLECPGDDTSGTVDENVVVP